MSRRNVAKVNIPNSYYHVCVRGVHQRHIFIDEADYRLFISLFERFLSSTNKIEAEYQKQKYLVEVLAYCLMPNHFHLLLYQINEDDISKLMHKIMISYSRYFNKKYGRGGPLFKSPYKASTIDSSDRLLHISRHIHLSPCNWIDYPHSSLRAYLYDDTPNWLNKIRITKLYGSAVKYMKFLEDYLKDNDELAT